MATRDIDAEKTYSGDEENAAAKFFDFDMAFEAYCEALFGDIGTEHWRGTAASVTAANLSTEADKLYRYIS